MLDAVEVDVALGPAPVPDDAPVGKQAGVGSIEAFAGTSDEGKQTLKSFHSVVRSIDFARRSLGASQTYPSRQSDVASQAFMQKVRSNLGQRGSNTSPQVASIWLPKPMHTELSGHLSGSQLKIVQ